MAKLIGGTTPVGVGGKNCACCKVAPGKARKLELRTAKRRERQTWKREARFATI